MKNIFLFTFIAFLLLSSCGQKKNAGLWFYTHSYGEAKQKHYSLAPVHFLNLRPDGSYTRDFGTFEHGSWEVNDKKLSLTTTSGTLTHLPIKFSSRKELKLVADDDLLINFDSRPSSYALKEMDPFSVENNRWRIRPAGKETEKEIRSRLINHCRFWEAYFVWALEKRIQYIDVRSTPTPIKIYGNGFALKNYHDLPDTWKSYFYDAEDCRVAGNLLHEAFTNGEIAWPNSDDKYKMFISAFQQLQQLIKRQENSIQTSERM